MSDPEEKDPREARREALRLAKAEREKEATAALEEHADLLLELEAKFATELGPRGVAFEIINEENDLGIGPIVVKPSDDLGLKRWDMTPEETPESRAQLVTACVVYPPNFTEITRNRPYIVKRCAVAVLNLAGLGARRASGKY